MVPGTEPIPLVLDRSVLVPPPSLDVEECTDIPTVIALSRPCSGHSMGAEGV